MAGFGLTFNTLRYTLEAQRNIGILFAKFKINVGYVNGGETKSLEMPIHMLLTLSCQQRYITP